MIGSIEELLRLKLALDAGNWPADKYPPVVLDHKTFDWMHVPAFTSCKQLFGFPIIWRVEETIKQVRYV